MENEAQKLFESQVAGMAVSYSVAACEVATDTGPHRRFGVLIESSGGDRAGYADIFATRAEAADFLATLCRCQVTPATLGDIVYDYLCRE